MRLRDNSRDGAVGGKGRKETGGAVALTIPNLVL